MKFIILNEYGTATKNRMSYDLKLNDVTVLPPLSNKRCFQIKDPLLGLIKIALNMNFKRGVARFEVSGHDIHSKIILNHKEILQIKTKYFNFKC